MKRKHDMSRRLLAFVLASLVLLLSSVPTVVIAYEFIRKIVENAQNGKPPSLILAEREAGAPCIP